MRLASSLSARLVGVLIGAGLLGGGLLAGSGAQASPPPDAAYTAGRPSVIPIAARSIFDPALRCMDDLLLRSGANQKVPLFLAPFEDARGNSQVSTRDLAVASLSRLSERSRFFRLFPKAQRTEMTAQRSVILMGSITGLDDSVQANGAGGGISLGPVALGANRRRLDGVLTITMYLTDFDGATLPGTVQSLSMVLQRETKSGDLTGSVGSVGGFMQLDFTRDDGTMQATRALIDLATIQLVASYAAVPPERCLALVSHGQAQRRTFDKMKPAVAIAAIAGKLAERGFYQGPVPTTLTPQLQQAIAAFQAQRGDPPLGEPNFDVWNALALEIAPTSQVANARLPASVDGGVGLAAPAYAQTAAAPVIKIAPRGTHLIAAGIGSYILGMHYRAEFAISTTTPAHIACFDIDPQGRATKIYPSLRNPDRLVSPGELLILPGPNDGYTVEATSLDPETIYCAASATIFRFPEPMNRLFDPANPGPRLPQRTPKDIDDALRAAGNIFTSDRLRIKGCNTSLPDSVTSCPK